MPAGLITSTTPIRTTHAGQIIENLDLWVSDGDAIRVEHDNVVIRNVTIHHADGNGIVVEDSSGVTVQNALIVNSDPPGGNQGLAGEATGIRVVNAPDFTASHVTLQDSGTGIYLGQSPGATLSHLEGHDFHGLYPSGQFVQFYQSPDGSLTDFSVINDPNGSHVEDNVSIIDSPNVTIANGVIDGNNSPSGVGVMFEGDSQGGHVQNVDVIHMGNGGFSSYSDDVSFVDTRSFDNIADDQGRGDPLSNAVIWNASGGNVTIADSTYTDPAVANNIVWGASSSGAEVAAVPSATPMAAIQNVFDWVAGTVGAVAGGVAGESPATSPATAPAATPAVGASPSGTSLDRDGTAGAETMTGSSAADDLDGMGGDDRLDGLAGDDDLYGGAGGDRLDGGGGTDHLWGGAGADRFAFKAGNGADWVEDFEAGGSAPDTIEISRSMFGSLDAVLAAAQDVGTDVAIRSGSDTLWLADTHKAELGAGHVLFV